MAVGGVCIERNAFLQFVSATEINAYVETLDLLLSTGRSRQSSSNIPETYTAAKEDAGNPYPNANALITDKTVIIPAIVRYVHCTCSW